MFTVRNDVANINVITPKVQRLLLGYFHTFFVMPVLAHFPPVKIIERRTMVYIGVSYKSCVSGFPLICGAALVGNTLNLFQINGMKKNTSAYDKTIQGNPVLISSLKIRDKVEKEKK